MKAVRSIMATVMFGLLLAVSTGYAVTVTPHLTVFPAQGAVFHVDDPDDKISMMASANAVIDISTPGLYLGGCIEFELTAGLDGNMGDFLQTLKWKTDIPESLAGQNFTVLSPGVAYSPRMDLGVGIHTSSAILSWEMVWGADPQFGISNNFVVTTIPEPSILLLLGGGLVGLAGLRRKVASP